MIIKDFFNTKEFVIIKDLNKIFNLIFIFLFLYYIKYKKNKNVALYSF